MAHERFEPEGLNPSKAFGYSQAVRTSGGSHVFCAGQVSWDAGQNVIGVGDFRTQMATSLLNVEKALAAAGAGRGDVTSLRIFVVDYDLEKLPVIGEELTKFFGEDNLPANTLLGIDKLALPDFMVEIEAFAVIE